MSTHETAVREALEAILDIMEEGKYFLRVGKLMEAIKAILSYFSEQMDPTFSATGPGVSAEQALATLEGLNDKMKAASFGQDTPEGFVYQQASLDPATIMIIINVAIQIIKLWRQLRG